MGRIPVVFIAGPTAVGKTDLSINLAKELDGEIISADSMQIYKYMDIGTAKITEEEMCKVKHYLIDEVEPDVEFSVVDFQQRAKKYINEIYQRGKIPIIAGGTGLYMNSLIYEMDFTKSKGNTKLRDKLQKEADEYGSEHLHNKLRKLDEKSANRIHPNNIKRVIRAIEVCLEGEEKIGDFKNDIKFNEDYYPILIILNRDRDYLYERINKRVDIMMNQGLLKEVNKLLEMGYNEKLTSLQAIGYKEIIKSLKGEYSIEDAVELIKRDSRRYAKRQITWFKRYDFAKWIDLDNFSSQNDAKSLILSYIEGILRNL
ncbi:MAG: tRNA (adenosine(37)-N6)-dimethylallyltransferase MiaA [Tepidibacter sp.]|jgi:tRNA dimethylallyltransferase|uniref:tRNA (adenosine(37)-N6)-dimethylallyltransferase MiaA n=1 Tax=Tepidibacter sp. TaxID=2529387 RepID=UPI0025FD4106|nr:tRNA (adenosine(37)-N6)-dimethylallyltransferase MiaA [Tepidibacter sp.]MCT4509282.1 tRNA (adenosine(37)-N6)-dimethylallyltransferase MiaA [Tepidibacter sp.]